MISPECLLQQIRECGFTHLVWVPDSATGLLQPLLDEQAGIRVVSVCREGEAWAIAAGLIIGGQKPVVIVQCTGLFESGDAFRNVTYDLQIPVFCIIGYRSYEKWRATGKSGDSARHYAEPILNAWGIRSVLVESDEDAAKISATYCEATAEQVPAAILLGEP